MPQSSQEEPITTKTQEVISSATGTNTQLATCAEPASGQRVTATCTAGSNTAIVSCSLPGDGQFLTRTCSSKPHPNSTQLP